MKIFNNFLQIPNYILTSVLLLGSVKGSIEPMRESCLSFCSQCVPFRRPYRPFTARILPFISQFKLFYKQNTRFYRIVFALLQTVSSLYRVLYSIQDAAVLALSRDFKSLNSEPHLKECFTSRVRRVKGPWLGNRVRFIISLFLSAGHFSPFTGRNFRRSVTSRILVFFSGSYSLFHTRSYTPIHGPYSFHGPY